MEEELDEVDQTQSMIMMESQRILKESSKSFLDPAGDFD